jgi:hypothetical protein
MDENESAVWARSSYCSDAACVEVAALGEGQIGLRDAKHPEQPHLRIPRDDWLMFLDGVAAGRYRNL